jgi:hypothetical protein
MVPETRNSNSTAIRIGDSLLPTIYIIISSHLQRIGVKTEYAAVN